MSRSQLSSKNCLMLTPCGTHVSMDDSMARATANARQNQRSKPTKFHGWPLQVTKADRVSIHASIFFKSPLSINPITSVAPPTSTPFTNIMGKVGQPVHSLSALRRPQAMKKITYFRDGEG